jgi:hypothetical protein
MLCPSIGADHVIEVKKHRSRGATLGMLVGPWTTVAGFCRAAHRVKHIYAIPFSIMRLRKVFFGPSMQGPLCLFTGWAHYRKQTYLAKGYYWGCAFVEGPQTNESQLSSSLFQERQSDIHHIGHCGLRKQIKASTSILRRSTLECLKQATKMKEGSSDVYDTPLEGKEDNTLNRVCSLLI